MKQIGVKCIWLWFILSCPAMFWACTTSKQIEEGDAIYIENQLKETQQKIEEMYHRVSVIQFMVDNHEKTLKDMDQRLKRLEGQQMQSLNSEQTSGAKKPQPVLKSTIGQPQSLATAQELYDMAFATFKKGDFSKAQKQFEMVASQYPKHDLADNALYWSGECLYTQKKFKDAINVFKKAVKEYPKGTKMPDSLLKIGFSYFSINDNKNARLYLKKLIKNYPFSPAASKAEIKLKEIK